MSIFIGFVPWILFWILSSNDSFLESVLAGLAAAVFIGLGRHAKGKLKTLEVATVAYFALVALSCFLISPVWLDRWINVTSNAFVALVVLYTLITGTPFTEQYAREQSPEEVWETPGFKHVNRVLTWAWFACFLIKTVSSAVTLYYPGEETLFTWIIPMGAFVGAIKLTAWYPQWKKRQYQQQAPISHA